MGTLGTWRESELKKSFRLSFSRLLPAPPLSHFLAWWWEIEVCVEEGKNSSKKVFSFCSLSGAALEEGEKLVFRAFSRFISPPRKFRLRFQDNNCSHILENSQIVHTVL